MTLTKLLSLVLMLFLIGGGCKQQPSVDIIPHPIDKEADLYYQQAVEMAYSSFDHAASRQSVSLLDSALAIDSFNPDYHGLKAKLYSEMGLLDSALIIQTHADSLGAVNGEYLFQLGLFQAAKSRKEEAKESFERSYAYLSAVMDAYPDSLGAFILQRASYALLKGNDSLFMPDVTDIRERFPDRLMELEMTRRVKPHFLIEQLKRIEEESLMNKLFQEEK